MTPTTETWLPVVGYEGYYEVSDHGNVRSLDRLVPSKGGQSLRRGRILSPGVIDAGRLCVSLSRDAAARSVKISALVLTAFVGPRPEGMVGCHDDGDVTNNRLTNLRWDTQSENIRDAVRHGTHAGARKTCCLRGHRLVGPNLLSPNSRGGRRACRACNRAIWGRRKAQLRGEVFDLQQAADAQYEAIMRAA